MATPRTSPKSKLDLDRVQNYIRKNPHLAIEYFAALVKANVEKRQGGFFGNLKNLFQQVADVFTGHTAKRNLLFRANLNGARRPLIGHLLICSDPLLDSLLQGGDGFLFKSRRIGAWPGPNETARESLHAELDLSHRMGAPTIMIVKHKDAHLASQDKCNCGCAFIAMGTTIMSRNKIKGLAPLDDKFDAVTNLALQMQDALGASALADLKLNGNRADDWAAASEKIQHALMEHSLREVRELTLEESPPRNIYGLVVDQRTGEVSSFIEIGRDNCPEIPTRNLRRIERDLFRIASGKQPKHFMFRAPQTATPACD